MGILLKFINSEAAEHLGNLEFLTTYSYGMYVFLMHFLYNSCNFQYLILGWSTLVLSPSVVSSFVLVLLVPRPSRKERLVFFCYLARVRFILRASDSSLVPRPHPAHARRRGLVSQVQILGPAEVPKPCNC